MSNDLFFEDAADDVSNSELEQIAQLAHEMQRVEQEIAVAEENLKDLKRRHYKLSTEDLPELMDSVHMASFTTVDGIAIEVSDQVSGSLPKDMTKREAALKWLKENGAEGIVKDSISVNLEKGQTVLADEIMADLLDLGVTPERKEDVNHMSLKAFAREQFSAGVDVPFQDLGLWRGRTTKLKRKS